MIDLRRPHDIVVRKSVAFLEWRNHVWDLIRSEAADTAGRAGSAGGAP